MLNMPCLTSFVTHGRRISPLCCVDICLRIRVSIISINQNLIRSSSCCHTSSKSVQHHQLATEYPRSAPCPVRWHHNEHDGVSNHQPHDCLLNSLFRRSSKKTSKLRVTGLCARNSPVIGEIPAQMASNAENVSIWWRHHVVDEQTACPAVLWSTFRTIALNDS